ncbi:hypothetical protein ACLUTX_00330 [Enterobacterales bacterium AE_CKDN230030158-1A_HGKHYDSX7]
MNEPQPLPAPATCRERRPVDRSGDGGHLRLRLSQWRRERLLRLALRRAEEPILVLEVAQLPGATWPVLLEHRNRIIVATGPCVESLQQAHQRLPMAMKRRIRDLPAPQDPPELRARSVDCLLLPDIPPGVCNAPNIRLLNQWIPVTRDSVILFARVSHRSSTGPAPDFSSAWALEREFQRLGFAQISHCNWVPGMDGVRIYILRK